jgi:hypothetical protein
MANAGGGSCVFTSSIYTFDNGPRVKTDIELQLRKSFCGFSDLPNHYGGALQG